MSCHVMSCHVMLYSQVIFSYFGTYTGNHALVAKIQFPYVEEMIINKWIIMFYRCIKGYIVIFTGDIEAGHFTTF